MGGNKSALAKKETKGREISKESKQGDKCERECRSV